MVKPTKLEPVSAEFERAKLGDERLTRRLMTLAETVATAPASSFPQMVSSESELEGVYRFLSNDRVTPRKIFAPHFASTRERIGQRDVLVVHDTTSFVFGGNVKRPGLGRFKSGWYQGFFGHFALAVDPGSRRPLGLVGYTAVVRQKPHRSHLRAGTSQEYARWSDLACEVQLDVPTAIHVMDREADSMQIFDDIECAGGRYVIRLNHNRRLVIEDDSDPAKLFDAMRGGEAMFERSVPISRRLPDPLHRKGFKRTHPPRAERIAKLRVRATPVTIRRPPGWTTDLRQPPSKMTVNTVLVEEVSAPKDATPVCWRLVTNLPIDTPTQVEAVVDAYRGRWVIEEFFKALKTGCQYERRQLETFRALANALAVFSVIAWRLLLLRNVARDTPHAPATTALTPRQVRVLERLASMKGPGVPAVKMPPNPTAADALLAVAKIGGHLTSNGPPGWQVLGRGYDSLLLIELGWITANATFGEK